MNLINFNSLLEPHSSWHIVYVFVSFANLMYMCTRVAFLKQDAVYEWVNDMVEISKTVTTPVTPTPVTPTPVTPTSTNTSELPEIDPIPQTTTKK
jgi:hypothetical protein